MSKKFTSKGRMKKKCKYKATQKDLHNQAISYREI